MNLNKVLLIGRLTADPQLRSTKTGQSVATFSLATNRVWTDKNNQKQEQVDFHNIVVWGKQAEIAAKYLLKGQVCYIEGRLATRNYEDKQGVKKYVTEVVAERVQFGPKAANSQGASRQAPGAGQSFPKEIADKPAIEEIPTINIDEDIKAEDLPF